MASYVPAPRSTLPMLGVSLQEVYPALPADGHALAVGMLSYDGQLRFGLPADADALPEITELPGLLLAREVAVPASARPRTAATVTSLASRRARQVADQSASDGYRFPGPSSALRAARDTREDHDDQT